MVVVKLYFAYLHARAKVVSVSQPPVVEVTSILIANSIVSKQFETL